MEGSFKFTEDLVNVNLWHSFQIKLDMKSLLLSGLYSCGQQFPSGGGLRMYVQILSISFRELIGEGGP